MEWISFNKDMPDQKSKELILGYDVWCGDPRIHVCEPEMSEVYQHGKKTDGYSLGVYKSICPDIGWGENPHWMPLPEKYNEKWIKYNQETYPYNKHLYEQKVIFKLNNGSIYVGFINSWDAVPSFNMMSKYVSTDAISHWMELPEAPKDKE